MFTEVVDHKQLTISEKYYVSNLSCLTASLMKEDLADGLCAQETDSLTLDKRNSLEQYIDRRIKITCGDFKKVQGKFLVDFPNVLSMTWFLLGNYRRACNESLIIQGPVCRRKGAERVRGLMTEEYIMKQVGSVREIKLSLDTAQAIKSCCAMIFIKNCLHDLHISNCSLLNETKQQYMDFYKFFDNAANLFGCEVEQCSGNSRKVGSIFWLTVIVVLMSLVLFWNEYINCNVGAYE